MTTPKRFVDAAEGSVIWVRTEDVRSISVGLQGYTRIAVETTASPSSHFVTGTPDEVAQKVWGVSPPMTVQVEVPERGVTIAVECGTEQVEVGGSVYRVQWSAQLVPPQ